MPDRASRDPQIIRTDGAMASIDVSDFVFKLPIDLTDFHIPRYNDYRF
jgi:hypothetical protein